MKRVGDLSVKDQTLQQKKAVRNLIRKLKNRGKKPYNSRAGVVRASIKGVYFEVSAITFKWRRTRSTGKFKWSSSSGCDNFLLLAEKEVSRGKQWVINKELEEITYVKRSEVA